MTEQIIPQEQIDKSEHRESNNAKLNNIFPTQTSKTPQTNMLN